MNAQEVATCCRISVGLMGGGDRGPGWAQVNMGALFVRDGDFLYDLAREMAREGEGIVERWGEIQRDNQISDSENSARRRLRSEALVVAGEVIDVMRHLEKSRRDRYQWFHKMIKKQTLRQIMRGVNVGDRGVVRASILWCSAHVEAVVGVERLDVLLTLRRAMA